MVHGLLTYVNLLLCIIRHIMQKIFYSIIDMIELSCTVLEVKLLFAQTPKILLKWGLALKVLNLKQIFAVFDYYLYHGVFFYAEISTQLL